MSFTVYPAIDVRDGRVVRLAQGDYARETRYPADPLAQAMAYADAGARWLHLVDLDAAREGGYTLLPLLRAIADDGRLQVQTGGGVRSAADAQRIFDAGASRLAFSVALALFLAFTHRGNLQRLWHGTESRFERARLLRRRGARA